MTFELDRFAWTPGALELSGRWRSDTPRRFRHVRLSVEEDGRRRRIAPVQQTPMRATPDGEPWAATFPWPGEAPPEAPQLEAGQSLLVELPAPHRVLVPTAAPAPDPGAEIAALRAELEAERELVAALKRRLAQQRARQTDAQAEEAAAHKRELAEAWKASQAIEAERAAVSAERERLAAQREQLAAAALAGARPEGHRWDHGARPAGVAPNGGGPRRGGIQHALELPRQPDDHVRGRAPIAVRLIAVALCAGVLVMLAMILGAVL